MWKRNFGTSSHRTFCVRKRNFKSQNILGIEYLLFLMQWSERHGSAGPLGQSHLGGAVITDGGAYWDFFLFSPILPSSNKSADV